MPELAGDLLFEVPELKLFRRLKFGTFFGLSYAIGFKFSHIGWTSMINISNDFSVNFLAAPSF